MYTIASVRFLAAGVASLDPGLGHYLRYGAILLATVVLVSVWMVRTWRNAPDPEDRWREAQDPAARKGGTRTRPGDPI
jgi:hypothetical protein